MSEQHSVYVVQEDCAAIRGTRGREGRKRKYWKTKAFEIFQIL